jgi:hypothetical protein
MAFSSEIERIRRKKGAERRRREVLLNPGLKVEEG